MNLLHYIKGLKRGKEAHLTELEALKDVFLSEALDGYDAIDDNHLKRIARLQKQVRRNIRNKNKTVAAKPVLKQVSTSPKINIPWKKWSVVAVFLLCLALGSYYLVKNYDSIFNRPASLSEFYKDTGESVEHEKDTVKLLQDTLRHHQDTIKQRQDTMIIYMPKPPTPKKNYLIVSEETLQDGLNEEGKKTEEELTPKELPSDAEKPAEVTPNVSKQERESGNTEPRP